ncbi:hypothetical protein AB0C12_03490 [Actinoplanes sp. NPDC048967]|uniref:hypothetical protein n=1 Tax=Actinoplanes sp. NPDC048967 TaxID=3155269 RepID=UPI0033E52F4F
MGTDELWQWIGVGINLAGLAVIITALVLVLRHRARARRSSALAGLAPAERRRVLRQIRGRAPVDPRDAPAARQGAGDLLGQRRLMATPAGLILVQVGQAVQHRSPVWTVLALVVTALCATAMILLGRDISRARRFLERHPA